MRIVICLLFIMALMPTVRADHSAGGQITYECLGNNEYRVTFTFIRDCEGINAPLTIPLEFFSNSCGIPSDNKNLFKVNTEDIDYCDGASTTCNGGSNPGYQKITYRRNVTLPAECPDWIIRVDISIRNATDFGGSGIMRLESLINNDNGLCNDSPTIDDNSVIVGCTNSHVIFNQEINATNGNPFTVVQKCPETNVGPMTYQGGMTCANPFPNLSGFNLTGTVVDFEPAVVGTSVIAYRIDEFDGSGNLIGFVEREMQIVILPTCIDSPPTIVNFPFVQQSPYTFYIDQGQPGCVTVAIGDPEGDDITDVTVDHQTLPGTPSHTIIINGSTAQVEICFHEQNADCIQEIYSFAVEATSLNCIGTVTESRIFTVIADPAPYCQDSVYYTDRNTTSGNIIPQYTKASHEIWVGDNMPVQSGIPIQNMGPVDIVYPVTLEAGVGINIPACQTGTGCVNFVGTSAGDIHLFIKPDNCNVNCPHTDLDVEVSQNFMCNAENLCVENVTGGLPPYTYNWYHMFLPVGINDPQDSIIQYLGSGQCMDIHNLISQLSYCTGDDQFLRVRLEVSDATGGILPLDQYVLGAQTFYQELDSNMYYFATAAPQGYYYNAHLVVCPPSAGIPGCAPNGLPFYVEDARNDSVYNCGPPYYGATEAELWIFSSSSQVIHYEKWDITDDAIQPFNGDWSIDNREISWNGHWNNDTAQACVDITDVFNYKLITKNCGDAHTEIGPILVVDGCYEGEDPPNVVAAGMPVNPNVFEADGSDHNDLSMQDNLDPEIVEAEHIRLRAMENARNASKALPLFGIYPNPTRELINIAGDLAQVQSIRITDSEGRLVLRSSNPRSAYSVMTWRDGIYIVKILTQDNVYTYRFVKQ